MRRIPMQKIQEALRLKYKAGLSIRQIATLGLASRSTLSESIARFESSGLSLEEALTMNPEKLQSRLFPVVVIRKETQRPQPDWNRVHYHFPLRMKGAQK